MLRLPAYRAAIGASLGIGWLTFGVRSSLIPLFVGEGLVLGTEWAGIGLGVFAMANALALFPSGRWVDRVARKPLMILGTATATAGMAILVAPADLALFLVAMAVSGAGTGILAAAPATIVADAAPARSGGWSSGQAAGYATGFALTTTVLAIGVVQAIRMPETRPS